MEPLRENVDECPELRDRRRVFVDRTDGGERLADLLEQHRAPGGLLDRDARPLILALPAGGVPVALAVARRFGLELDIAAVSKITPPWNTEVGYGAVAFDGSVFVDSGWAATMGLSPGDIGQGIEAARQKVRRRMEQLRGPRPMPDPTGRTIILIDDGLASGVTMRTAVRAILAARTEGPRVLVAVPTGHIVAVNSLAAEAARVCCVNIRGGMSFAVADAYRNWRDLSEREVAEML